MRIGMIGLDTSHVPAFARLMNGGMTDAVGYPVRIVAACPAGSPEFPMSRDRLAGFTAEIRELGIRIVDSIEELLTLVDGVMVQSVDGRQHWAQAKPVFKAGKPVFIDKPLAASLTDVRAIFEAGRRTGVPWFTASAMRYSPGYPELRQDAGLGPLAGCDVFGPSRTMPGHPDLYWYGVHGIDLLFSLMGTGCERVSAIQTGSTEMITGIWTGGRVGTFRGIRDDSSASTWGVTAFGMHGIRHVSHSYDYEPLVREIARFFCTGQAPISVDEMTEVFEMMTAAEISRDRSGTVVTLAELRQMPEHASGSMGSP